MKLDSRTYLAFASLPLLLAAVGCSDADTTVTTHLATTRHLVDREQLEAFLTESGVTGASDLSCGGLADKVDATTTCTLTLEGEELEVPVRVSASDSTSVTVEFDGAALGIG